MHALQPPGNGKPKERRQRRDDAEQLQAVRALAQNQQRANQRPQRRRCADGRRKRKRQVFQAEVGENPRRRDDGGFQQQLQMLHRRERVGDERCRQQSGTRHLREEQHKPHQRARQRAEKQNRQHGVVPDGVLDAKVIHAEEQRRQQAGFNPVHQMMITICRSGVPAERRQLIECKIWRLSAESRYTGSKSKTGEPLWPARQADGFKSVRAAYQFRPGLSANSWTGLIHLQFRADLLFQLAGKKNCSDGTVS